jgi:peptidoglycan L-alanyl-D-glutamate endopeptidase CwlK
MSRNIDDLHPWVAAKARAFLEGCAHAGVPVLITRTLTTQEVQSAIYAIGRRPLTKEETTILKNEGLFPSDATRTKTNAQNASDTSHGPPGLAFDCVPLHPANNGVWWDAPGWVWNKIYRVGEHCGLDALGDEWGEFLAWDKGHFQEPGWRILRSLDPALSGAGKDIGEDGTPSASL